MAKGLISGIKRMEIHDGDGIRTTVFFKGCPLRCVWCHNPESISFVPQIAKFQQKCIGCGTCQGERTSCSAALCPTEALWEYGKEYQAETLAEILMADKPFFDVSHGGVTLSGGECLAQPDFAVELARILHESGVSVYVDTCGHADRQVLQRIMPFTDVFLYDVKAIDPNVHAACTGRDNSLILGNLAFLSENACRIRVRYPLVVGYNDGECEKVAEFLSALGGIEEVKVLRYHAFAASRYEALGMKNTLPPDVTTEKHVKAACQILISHRLNVTT